MKKVIMFTGQGSQYKGMGKSLFKKYKEETKVASEILGYDIEELCTQDPNKQLGLTQFTQPALYTVNNFLFKEYKKIPEYAIGHSLGEYNALLAADVFDFETGLKLVQKRGELMASASGGGMAAVLGIGIDQLQEELAAEHYKNLDVANYNTPTQTVIAGKKEDIKAIVKDFEQRKIKIIPLMVSAPFHSRYMVPIVEEYFQFIKQFEFRAPSFPVIANATGLPYTGNDTIVLLSKQISNSVAWVDSIRYLMGKGVETFEELGGIILTKMVKEIREKCTPKEEVEQNNIADTQLAPVLLNKLGDQNDKLSNKLGSKDFRTDFGVSYSYVAGGMYRGTASADMVIRMGKANMLSFLGTGGMPLEEMSKNIDKIQSALTSEEAYGMNFLHHLTDPAHEMKTVELFLNKGVQNIEAAAFMQITEAIAYFRVSGLSIGSEGQLIQNTRIIGKVSRPEVAEAFMKPVPAKFLESLLEKGKISKEQAELAKQIPLCYDICVEADSGGHTDGGIPTVLLPSIQKLRDEIQEEYTYAKKIRVGLAGGIGTPQSMASAFVMGADFVLTGSINQCTVEAGTSNLVKDLLQGINVQDTDYAPAGDMFEIGAKVQVLKKGVLFPARANKLYNLYSQYNSIDEIPEKTISQLEKNYFKKNIEQVWEETKAHFMRTNQTHEIEKAAKRPKHKMALIFRWYFGFSSRVAFAGDVDHKVNFQIHTGPALGAFNQWVKGTDLEDWRNRNVDIIGEKLMESTAELLKKSLVTMV